MESIKLVLLIFGLSFIASGIVDAFNLTWWGFWLIVIIIIVAYTSIAIFLEEGGFQEYRENKKERKRKENEKERELKRKEAEQRRLDTLKESNRRISEIQDLGHKIRIIYDNSNAYQDVEDINSTKNDCPNCGRSDGRHDPKCYI
tara:strand:+ start:75 stop:509 length:435 start_codon:yes stop_codon:yes gene_type:complete